MSGIGGRVVLATSNAVRKLGNALDNVGAMIEVAKYSERLVPSTRFVAVDGVGPKTDPECAFVAPSASLVGDVSLGKGSSVWYGAAIRADVNPVTIGENSSIGDRAVVHVAKIQGDYPTIIGNNVTVGPGAVVHAATLKDNCVVGASAQVLDGSVVEPNAIVAAGAVVTPKSVVKANQLWAGSPAKMVRELTAEEVASILDTAEDTLELAFVHADECAKDTETLHEDALEYEDTRIRDPEYIFQPPRKGDDLEETDVSGLGSPGLVFDDALNAPEKWLKENEQRIKDKFQKAKE
eukprot:CAMPEP_0195523474 /NCGR_PEP_ID=MMETSP0794_2-20130614/22694_1 /TAXON_ID=515487 /ORGANISM="Stephanopyxis turris, Strain CCMP 815" /LENGTH=293 /DNA_ID=CAMNT_0040653485 /DNA_START=42 /DNA_END=923 /DNA_ORIENTATION=+